MNNPGNPQVKISDPYLYPSKPVPVPHGYGFIWVRVWGTKKPDGSMLPVIGVVTKQMESWQMNLADAPTMSNDMWMIICKGEPVN